MYRFTFSVRLLIEDKARIVQEILKSVGAFSLLWLNTVTQKEFQWYRRFAKKMVEVE